MPKKILLVDDEPQIVMLVSSRLRANGYEVLTAGDGEEGLRRARCEQPDLVILDLMMPKMDGYQVCASLKGDTRYANIPVLIFTAKASEEERRVGLEDCGANGFLMKPFDPSVLLAKVSEILK